MRRIYLTQGQHTTVDDEDYYELNQHNWCAVWNEKSQTFYALRKEWSNGGYTTRRMHRVIMRAKDGEQIDHKDGNGLNNQKSNLRIATATQNMRNRRKRAKGLSRYKGAAPMKGTSHWRAYIRINKKLHHLGCFPSEEEAALVYNKAAVKHFGEFASLNILRIR